MKKFALLDNGDITQISENDKNDLERGILLRAINDGKEVYYFKVIATAYTVGELKYIREKEGL